MIQRFDVREHQHHPETSCGRPAVIEVRSLMVSYADRAALRELSFTVREAEVVLITGPTGCGKSTLALALSGLIPHVQEAQFSGQVIVNGMDTVKHPLHEITAQTGVVFQNPSTQLFHTTVEEEIGFAPRNLGLPEGEILSRIDYALESVGICHLRGRLTRGLSMGEKQRLAIASILSLKPKLLILDEPTANLDSRGIEKVVTALRRLNNEQGITILIIEHRLSAFYPWVSRVMVLESGRMVVDSSPHEPDTRRRLDRLGLSIPTANPNSTFRDFLRRQTISREHKEPPVVTMEGIEAGYGKTLCLRGVELALHRGELTALVGENGAGKSTIARVLTGLLRPRKGKVRWDPPLGGLPLGRRLGFLHHNVLSQLLLNTVEEEVAFAPRNFKLNVGPLVERSLQVADLKGLAERLPHCLSIGEQQRAALAAVLSADPQLIILDEPTVGQDWIHLSTVMGYLAALTRQGKSVLVITHDERLVLEFADRVVYLQDGRIATDGGYTLNAARTELRAEAQCSCLQRARGERDRA